MQKFQVTNIMLTLTIVAAMPFRSNHSKEKNGCMVMKFWNSCNSNQVCKFLQVIKYLRVGM